MTRKPGNGAYAASVDAAEVAKFAALAAGWWDPEGDFRPLHRLNPVRLAFLRDQTARHFGREALGEQPLQGLDVIDVGCGGGLLCEPLARLGARVTGIDADEESRRVAALHAEESGLAIDYRRASAEELAAGGAAFDLVVSMEVVEHVADLAAFLTAACALVKPGGALALATLNRTPKAFVTAILGAEYFLRWLPRGTHDWRRFVRPSELAAGLRRSGLTITEMTGVAYNPLTDGWHRTRDLAVNYMVFAVRDCP